ncbi:CYP3A4 [Cordylochernes scorpioides]|uniref:CYP3A4 n=1 Tax=Cordylochernes scorpioides TaxID=51811 RepID=A0ABY6LIJ6_9ARAC|nr:CYP3A4 [Cordylochernes scorpioides]
MEATYLLAAGVLLITYILFKLRQRSLNFSTFHQLGIPGPEPSFLWGNLPEINSKGIGVCTVQWYRQYGEIFGVYLGARPFLFIANPDVLRDFLVKDFNNFTDKDVSMELINLFLEGFGGDDKRVELVLEGLRGEAWKALRMKLSPTFSTGKLRQMRPFVLASWAELEQKLPSDRTVDIGALTASAVMDISISVFAGIKEPVQEQPNSRLANAIREAMAISFSDLPIILASKFYFTTIL